MERGDVLAKPGSLQVTMMVDVRLRMLPEVERTIKSGSRLHFYCGAKELLCKAVLLGGVEELLPGESCYAQLRFEEAIALKAGDILWCGFIPPSRPSAAARSWTPSRISISRGIWKSLKCWICCKRG